MSDFYCYLDFSIKIREKVEFLPVFIKGSIQSSLSQVFGEIGGQFELDLISFNEERQKGIIRVPLEFAAKTRVALTLISEFQEIPALFQVNKVSNHLISLTTSFIEI